MPFYRGRRRPDSDPRIEDRQSRDSTLPRQSYTSKNGPPVVSSGPTDRHRWARIRALVMLVALAILVFSTIFISHGVDMNLQLKSPYVEQLQSPKGGHVSPKFELSNTETQVAESVKSEPRRTISKTTSMNEQNCEFRSYPPSRLYGLYAKKTPSFLFETTYIRGQLPIAINHVDDESTTQNNALYSERIHPNKVCVNTSSWENLLDGDGLERLPFTDGHNPSVISLKSNPYETGYSITGNKKHLRLDPKYLQPIASALPSQPLATLFLGISVLGNGQCKFGLTPEEVIAFRFSVQNEPPNGKRAVITILSPPNSGDYKPFHTLAQTTLLLELDAKYGTTRRAHSPKKTDSGYARVHQEFDDPRLFFYGGRVWVLYRNGPLFGYNDQIHNPIHFEESSMADKEGGIRFLAYVKASETVRVCCGRNIALISEEVDSSAGEIRWVSNPTLKALTWVDPVTVVDVELGDTANTIVQQRLNEVVPSMLSLQSSSRGSHRRLGAKSQSPKSNVHGTNGYMVPLPTGELLGIAHFHRPEHRQSSEYALHGHHYTHAFFTIARQDDGGIDFISRPFKLKRLSNEFVFQSQSKPMGSSEPYTDADIIQFASGLDLVGSDVDGTLIIAYGINDCEGAVLTVSMEKVSGMLIPVNPGQEVVDLMARLSNSIR